MRFMVNFLRRKKNGSGYSNGWEAENCSCSRKSRFGEILLDFLQKRLRKEPTVCIFRNWYFGFHIMMVDVDFYSAEKSYPDVKGFCSLWPSEQHYQRRLLESWPRRHLFQRSLKFHLTRFLCVATDHLSLLKITLGGNVKISLRNSCNYQTTVSSAGFSIPLKNRQI